MDTYIVRAQCHNCGADVEFVLSHHQKQKECDGCGEQVIRARKAKGYIYVMSNPKSEGVIKVGKTDVSVEARAKSLKTAGVPAKPVIEGYFYSYDPKQDEQKAHEKLRRFKFEREHFEIDPVTALIRLANLFKREPMFLRPATAKAYAEQRRVNAEEVERKFNRSAQPKSATSSHPLV